MPSSSRAAQVDLSATCYYHCVSRCVRRAFLCGKDAYSGKTFDHRKPWLLDRLRHVTRVFAIDVCAYAVLSNHFHVVLRVDVERANELTDEAVLRRYGKLFPRAAAEARALPTRARAARLVILRERLTDISWFMRSVNEYIARRANKEDECTGRFWEGRFKSQSLLDEVAVLTCMSYVDLNPVRAGICESLEELDFTSIQQRLREAARKTRSKKSSKTVPLAPFRGERSGVRAPLPMRIDDYIALLDWSGRAARAKPGGRIRGAPPSVLEELGIDIDAWLDAMSPSGLKAFAALGDEAHMAAEAERRGKRWLHGKRLASNLYRRAA